MTAIKALVATFVAVAIVQVASSTPLGECIQQEIDASVRRVEFEYKVLLDRTFRIAGIGVQLRPFLKTRDEIFNELFDVSSEMLKAANVEELSARRSGLERVLDSKLGDWTERINTSTENFLKDSAARERRAKQVAMKFIDFGKGELSIIEVNAEVCFDQ